jgi:hypothetical protein
MKLSGVGKFLGRSYVGILPISTILTMWSAISIATCFTFFPGNEFGFLHDAFEKFVLKDWKGLSLERAARPIHRIPARRFYMNPEQEIELVLRVPSTQPTDEEVFHLEHEDVSPEGRTGAGRRTGIKAGRRARATARSRRRPALIDFLQNHLGVADRVGNGGFARR